MSIDRKNETEVQLRERVEELLEINALLTDALETYAGLLDKAVRDHSLIVAKLLKVTREQE